MIEFIEGHYLWVGLGMILTLFSAFEVIRRLIAARIARDADISKILQILMEINSVENQLVDVLNHPDDSGFGVNGIGDDISEIKRLCVELQRHQEHNLSAIKAIVQRIESAIERRGNERH
jgi:hypothetical protein